MVSFDVDRDDKFIEAMIEKEAFFWTQVLDKIPPEPDGSIATTDTLKRLYPEDSGEIVPLPAEAAEWDRDIVISKGVIKRVESEKRAAENKLKAALGTATTGVLPTGGRYTFKQQTNNYPAKEAFSTSFRVLRRAK